MSGETNIYWAQSRGQHTHPHILTSIWLSSYPPILFSTYPPTFLHNPYPDIFTLRSSLPALKMWPMLPPRYPMQKENKPAMDNCLRSNTCWSSESRLRRSRQNLRCSMFNQGLHLYIFSHSKSDCSSETFVGFRWKRLPWTLARSRQQLLQCSITGPVKLMEFFSNNNI